MIREWAGIKDEIIMILNVEIRSTRFNSKGSKIRKDLE